MKLVRCNRCGAEREILSDKGLANKYRAWAQAGVVAKWSKIQEFRPADQEGVEDTVRTFDLCEDCREVFLLQFMTGAGVAPITKPAHQTPLPHDPMQDCALAFDPETGAFVCFHDNPERFRHLTREALPDAVGDEARRIKAVQAEVNQIRDVVEGGNSCPEPECDREWNQAMGLRHHMRIAHGKVKGRGVLSGRWVPKEAAASWGE
jgi:hypothetical protein